MQTWLKAKAVLPWVDRPTVVSSYSSTLPGEEVTLYSRDNGETWFFLAGMGMPASFVKVISQEREYGYSLWEKVKRLFTGSQVEA